jgi:hypothetical protein
MGMMHLTKIWWLCLVKSHEDLIPFDLYFMSYCRFRGGHRHGGAGFDVELRAVAGTGDCA